MEVRRNHRNNHAINVRSHREPYIETIRKPTDGHHMNTVGVELDKP